MSSDFIPKRPHKKSRGGCGTCKSRKVKCDESKPKCTYCEKRNLTCLYISRPTKSLPTPPDSQSPSPTPNSLVLFDSEHGVEDINRPWELTINPSTFAVRSSIGNLSPTDLRYMHLWSTTTWNSLAVGNWANGVLQMQVPDLAFEHDFLMNTMLGIASLHSQQLLPDSEQTQRQTAIYRARALNGFRHALKDVTWGTRKYEAALITSLLVVILCSKDYEMGDRDLVIIHWLTLYRGLASVIKLKSYPAIFSLSVAPIFRREIAPLQASPVIPKILVNMVRDIGPLEPDFELLENYCNALDALGLLYGQLQEDGTSPGLSIRAITWPSYLTQPFVVAAQEKQPRALVILAYYMVFTKLVKGLWWVDGIADREFWKLLRMLDPKWLPYVEVPVKAMMMGNDDEIVELMLK